MLSTAHYEIITVYVLVYCIEVEHVGKKPDLICYETWRVLSLKGFRFEFGSGKLSLPQSFVDQKLVCFTDMFSSGVLPHRCNFIINIA